MAKLKRDSEPQSEKKEISSQEVRGLQQEIEKFTQKRIGGELVSPFYQYMMACGILRLINGEWLVIDPPSFQLFSQVEEKRKSLEAWKSEQDGTRVIMPERPENLIKKLS